MSAIVNTYAKQFIGRPHLNATFSMAEVQALRMAAFRELDKIKAELDAVTVEYNETGGSNNDLKLQMEKIYDHYVMLIDAYNKLDLHVNMN